MGDAVVHSLISDEWWLVTDKSYKIRFLYEIDQENGVYSTNTIIFL